MVISLFIIVPFTYSCLPLDLTGRAIVHGDLKPENILIGSDHLFHFLLLLRVQFTFFHYTVIM